MAAEYVQVMCGKPDGWGMHCHPKYGASHWMLLAMHKRFGSKVAEAAIDTAFENNRKGRLTVTTDDMPRSEA
jgi:hypothetical protein